MSVEATALARASRHEKYSNRRAPDLTTLMTPSTDMPWNFKTPSLLLIYGCSAGMESLVLKKTKALQVDRLLHCDAAPRLSIGNQVICHVTVHKHLGVLLRQDLKWSNHIHEVVSKATRKAALLRFMMHNLTDSLTIKRFLCYVRPPLEYASPLWHGTISKDDALAMERIQAAVARRILRGHWHTPKSDLLAQLNRPALRWRREIASLCLLHQLLNSRPEPLSDFLFPFVSSCASHYQRKPRQLILGPARITQYSHSFFF